MRIALGRQGHRFIWPSAAGSFYPNHAKPTEAGGKAWRDLVCVTQSQKRRCEKYSTSDELVR